MPGKPIVALAGGIGSGKSSVADELAARLGCKLARFGEYVRSIAAKRGLDPRREVLQGIGEQLISRDVMGFVRAVLDRSGWKPGDHLVVDGIRHVEAMAALRELAKPQSVLLVYLDVDDDARQARVACRDGSTKADLALAEAHSTEAQVRSLVAGMADLVVDARSLTATAVGAILTFIGAEGSRNI